MLLELMKVNILMQCVSVKYSKSYFRGYKNINIS